MDNKILTEGIENAVSAKSIAETSSKKYLKPLLIIGLVFLLILLVVGIIYYFLFLPNPQRILAKAVNNMATVQNLHFTETVSETKTNGTISNVSGDVVFPDKLSLNLIPGLKDMETVIINGKVYTKWLNNWSLVSGKNPEEFNIDNPKNFIELLSSTFNVKSLGTEKIDNQAMNHLEFTINKIEAQKTFLQTSDNNYTGEVWIGESDGLIHRIAITFTPATGDAAPRKYQMDFSNFNGNIIIEEPKIK